MPRQVMRAAVLAVVAAVGCGAPASDNGPAFAKAYTAQTAQFAAEFDAAGRGLAAALARTDWRAARESIDSGISAVDLLLGWLRGATPPEKPQAVVKKISCESSALREIRSALVSLRDGADTRDVAALRLADRSLKSAIQSLDACAVGTEPRLVASVPPLALPNRSDAVTPTPSPFTSVPPAAASVVQLPPLNQTVGAGSALLLDDGWRLTLLGWERRASAGGAAQIAAEFRLENGSGAAGRTPPVARSLWLQDQTGVRVRGETSFAFMFAMVANGGFVTGLVFFPAPVGTPVAIVYVSCEPAVLTSPPTRQCSEAVFRLS